MPDKTNKKTPECLFVDENLNVLTGEAARRQLAKISDAKFLTESGVTQVDESRWRMAQNFEKNYQLKRAADALQDRNKDHYLEFEGFKCLRGYKFNEAIELGCGPFTNLRRLAESGGVEITSCSLEDPLILDYLEHRHCAFDKNYLYFNRKLYRKPAMAAIRKILNLFSPETGTKTTIALSRKISPKLAIKHFIPEPIEEMAVPEKFDLIIMINVIEHCRDAYSVFDKIKKLADKQAVFIFSDKYYYLDQISARVKNHLFDAGHPLLIDRGVIENFLHDNFETIYEKVKFKEFEVNGMNLGYDSVYFIGHLKS